LKIVIFKTSDDVESHIVVNVSLTLTNTTIWFVAALCLIVDVWTYGRMDGRTVIRTDRRTFLPGLLGHLSGDDLKMERCDRVILGSWKRYFQLESHSKNVANCVPPVICCNTHMLNTHSSTDFAENWLRNTSGFLQYQVQ